MRGDTAQLQADIEEAFFGLGDDDAEAHAAKARLLRLATPEGLVAALRQAMTGMKPGSRLDVIDALCAGYCVHCGDAVKDVCHCTNDE